VGEHAVHVMRRRELPQDELLVLLEVWHALRSSREIGGDEAPLPTRPSRDG